MKCMTHRERVLAALNLQEPDRLPLDFGSTTASTIVDGAYENLMRFLGLDHQIELMSIRGRTVIPNESVLKKFDIDTRPLLLGNVRGITCSQTSADSFVDEWGTKWKKVSGGHYIPIKGALQECDPTMETLESFSWPDPNDPRLYYGVKERAKALRNGSDFAIVLSLQAGLVHHCQFIRGYSEWLLDLYENTEYACCMMDIVADIWVKIAENALHHVGDNVDVIAWGDDFATQESTVVSPQMYREFIKPRHKRVVDTLKSNSRAKVHFHTCGSVYTVIGDLIDIGIDALNPVQVSARNMDPAKLKREFGGRLAFWGGIDTQKVLPFGSAREVREEVRKMIDCMGQGGGYILSSVHNIQAEVPPENIMSMFAEAKAYGAY